MIRADRHDILYTDLRQQPHFAETIADRIWRAWWQPSGHGFETVLQHLREFLVAETMPLCVVAYAGETYVGSALVIDNDLSERPDFSPWVAALWVEPEFRNFGVGSEVLRRAGREAFGLGFESVYLCALPPKAPFYAARGWTLIETGVGPHDLSVFARRAG